jgi:hypothetical protein
VYLPALSSLVADMHTTDGFAAASVAVYMAAVGALCLVWGPFSGGLGPLPTPGSWYLSNSSHSESGG